jgi:hypothetical protein
MIFCPWKLNQNEFNKVPEKSKDKATLIKSDKMFNILGPTTHGPSIHLMRRWEQFFS